jgi:hypothetical protein
MAASVTLEKTGLEKMFEFYGTVKQKTLPEVLRIHARLVCVELSRRTQPFGDKSGEEKVGASAIARDLLGGKKRYGIFAPITDFMAQNAEENGSGTIRLFAKKNGEVYGTDQAHFLTNATPATMRGIHKGAFKNGQVSSAGTSDRKIGRWIFINKYFVPKSSLSEYVAAQQAKVGIAKSGWAACAKQLKTGKGSATRGIPRWVTRHLGDYGLGIVQDMADDTANPRIVLTNTCKYADKVCPENQQQQAVAIVVGKMIKQLTNMLRYERRQLQKAA